ncbi:MAG: inositol monophosphatase [Candidatus Hydrogenedentes bacterium]|nr:inositol monophosphatase [Candidatus Hydrogenedentota bacterium]
MSAPYDAELRLAMVAARKAGEVLAEAMQREHQILSQEGRDIKLQADRDAEQIILDELASSAYNVLAEESGEHGELDAGKPFWIVDPLDGTLNFSRGIPACCVSIALSTVDTPILGVVYDFNRDELFSGLVGAGCWLNAAPVRVSSIERADLAVLSTGFPVNFEYTDEGLHAFAERIRRFRKVRMFGSAALSLSYVACGRVDAYSEDDIMFWDVAAGLALVQAAGGFIHVEPSRKKWARRVRCAAHRSIWGL